MHKPEHVNTFGTATEAVGVAVGNLIDHVEQMLSLVSVARQRLGDCDLSIARLRRNADEPEDMGTLNSLSAVQSRNKALAAGIESFSQAALQLLDLDREIRLLHPRVLAALRTPKEAPKELATSNAEPPQ